MIRYALAGVAVLSCWLLVFAWAAGMPFGAPLFAAEQVAMNGRDFSPVAGAGVDDGTALGIGAIASDGNALQSTTLDRVDAAKFRILNYRFEDFPRTLELVLVFRRADAPADVQTLSLPWPGDGPVTIDLQRATDAWRGEIVELGFAEYATPQLVPPSVAFAPFRLERAHLSPPAWNQLPRLLGEAWFGYRPWSLKSVNVVGPPPEERAPSLPATLVVGLLASIGVAAWLLLWNRQMIVRALAAAAAVAWLVLDLRWFDDFSAKHRLTDALYGHKSWQDRARLVADEDVAGFAQLTRQQLGAQAPRRILVAADSTYTLLRLIYFLLPLNAAPLESALHALPVRDWPADTVVVLCASKRWHFDDAKSALVASDGSIPATALFRGGNLAIFRVGAPR